MNWWPIFSWKVYIGDNSRHKRLNVPKYKLFVNFTAQNMLGLRKKGKYHLVSIHSESYFVIPHSLLPLHYQLLFPFLLCPILLNIVSDLVQFLSVHCVVCMSKINFKTVLNRHPTSRVPFMNKWFINPGLDDLSTKSW